MNKESNEINPLNEQNVCTDAIQQLLEEDDVNSDGKSNLDIFQCGFSGC